MGLLYIHSMIIVMSLVAHIMAQSKCNTQEENDQDCQEKVLASNVTLLIMDRRKDMLLQSDTLGDKLKPIPIGGVSSPSAVVYDAVQENVYWSDTYERTIMVASLNAADGDPTARDLFSGQRKELVYGLTMSPSQGTLFFTTHTPPSIQYIEIITESVTVVTDSMLSDPRGITYDDDTRYLYWCDINHNGASKIEKMRVGDPITRASLIDQDILYPTGIGLDTQNGYLYWCDHHLQRIESTRLDFSGRRIVGTYPGVDPYDVVVHGVHIYTTGILSKSILRIHAFTGEYTHLHKGSVTSYGIDIHSKFQDGNNCQSIICQNGTCLEDIDDFYCLCVEGFNGRFCGLDYDECYSSPCLHDGQCTDMFRGYECACADGYTGDICELDVDECLSSPCLHGGKCYNEEAAYKCVCEDNWAGEYCQIAKRYDPIIEHIGPGYGPGGGGTNITVIGNYLNLGEHAVLWLEFWECTTLFRNKTTIITQTPALEDTSFIDRALVINLKVSGGVNTDTQYTFTYKPDPEITKVYPLETIINGGTKLTVSGNSLNAAAKPLMEITRVYRYLVDEVQKLYDIDITVFLSPCNVSSSSQMICPTPELGIPDNFKLDTLSMPNKRDVSGKYLPRSKNKMPNSHLYQNGQEFFVTKRDTMHQRQKRQENIKTSISNDNLQFYLGFIFDGVDDYKNLTDSLPEYSKIVVYTEPEFKVNGQQIVDFRPGDSIALKGSDLDVGCTIDDYVITIGKGLCGSLELTSNALFCYPPVRKPLLDNNNTNGHPQVIIRLGLYVRHHWGSLKYPPEDNTPYSTIIPTVIMLVILLYIITTIACIAHRKRQWSKKTLLLDNVDDGVENGNLEDKADTGSDVPGPSGETTVDKHSGDNGEYLEVIESEDTETTAVVHSLNEPSTSGYLIPVEAEKSEEIELHIIGADDEASNMDTVTSVISEENKVKRKETIVYKTPAPPSNYVNSIENLNISYDC